MTTRPNLPGKLEELKNRLLDLGKRNKMINYRRTKRSTLRILSPDYAALFNMLAIEEKSLTFQRPLDRDTDFRAFALVSLMGQLGSPVTVNIGDIATAQPAPEAAATLHNLRSKARLAMEEQGTNFLYLSFGFVEWREKNTPSSPWLRSPLLMMPVRLTLENVNAPYVISRYDDDIEVNPTLDYRFNQEFGLDLPTFELKDAESVVRYMDEVEKLLDERGWRLHREVDLGLVSFLKISMYHDLNEHGDKALLNPVIRAMCGGAGELPALPPMPGPDETPPDECFQVLGADASQQDAIRLSKAGVSFVMQGPPGTGKSQTITNIIAEALADGKRVLFVSEKAAALQVVLKRLEEARLGDFCLSMHSHKANKREILRQLDECLKLGRTAVTEEALQELAQLQLDRSALNLYARELHAPMGDMKLTLYEAFGRLSALQDAPALTFTFDCPPMSFTPMQLQTMTILAEQLEGTLAGLTCPPRLNPWLHTTVPELSAAFRAEFRTRAGELPGQLRILDEAMKHRAATLLPGCGTVQGACRALVILRAAGDAAPFPAAWLDGAVRERVATLLEDSIYRSAGYREAREALEKNMDARVLTLPIEAALEEAESIVQRFYHFPLWKGAALSDLFSSAGHIAAELTALDGQYRALRSAVETLQLRFGVKTASRPDRIAALRPIAAALRACLGKTRKEWLRANQHAADLALLNTYLTAAASIRENRAMLDMDWDSDALHLDPAHMRHTAEQYALITGGREDLMQEPPEDVIRRAAEACTDVTDMLDSLLSAFDGARSMLSLTGSDTLADLTSMAELLPLLAEVGEMNPLWLHPARHEEAAALAADLTKKTLQLEAIEAGLKPDWEQGIFDLDAKAMLTRFKTDYASFFQRVLHLGSYNSDIRTLRGLSRKVLSRIDNEDAFALLTKLREHADLRAALKKDADRALKLLGVAVSDRAAVKAVHDRVSCAAGLMPLLRRLDPANSWESETIATLVSTPAGVAALKNAAAALSPDRIRQASEQLRSALPALYAEDVGVRCMLLPALQELKQRLASLQADYQELRTLCLLPAFTGQAAAELTDRLIALADLTARLEAESAAYDRLFGSDAWREALQTGAAAAGEQLHALLTHAGVILDAYPAGRIPPHLITSLTAAAPKASLAAQLDEICAALSEENEALLRARTEKYVGTYQEDKTFTAALERIDTLVEAANALERCAAPYAECLLPGAGPDALYACVRDAQEVRRLQQLMLRGAGDAPELFGSLWQDADTDWEGAARLLKRVNRLFERLPEGTDASAFLGWITSDPESEKEIAQVVSVLAPLTQGIESGVKYLTSLFAPEAGLERLSPAELADRTERCLSQMDLVEESLTMARATKRLQENGLAGLAEAIGRLDAPPARLKDSLMREFYRQWVQTALMMCEPVRSFRRDEHEEHVASFCRADDRQLAIARARIRSRVIEKYPDPSRRTVNGDELAVLKRELGKKMRHMPIRRLFRTIPNLLMTLKPCFMMSPLSVSYFLEADSYQFDMVIFDEASQIFPQDALGSMMRGSQVIIAGDTKQMPPTNFFMANTTNPDGAFDGDGDDDGYDDTIGDSILEEAERLLPASMLLWHYRSRSEQLIAFSNREIYRGDLITFPSCRESVPDEGVEFIHVPDGVYEPKPVNANAIEAARCAALVMDHIARHPERSLGVIAFSEKQQQAIENALHLLRLESPATESFFREDREEPFFIKNLENAQGDERDTIIFSVGYGYTQYQRDHGRDMAMRFGPLGSAGGERRLNVAITRAKHNIKLVSSILPEDIDLSRTKSEGVRLLRGYMEFAIRGESALSPTHEGVRRDALVDEVARVIEAEGYRVRKYVGSSGYRIDLAVEMPDDPTRLAAAIELDGPTYVSARTARDRDHLRRSVLTGMGWRVMRLWSAQWHRDPEGESRRLLRFIRSAVAGEDLPPDLPLTPAAGQALPENPIERPVADASDAGDGTRYGFLYYDAAPARTEYSYRDAMQELIDREQPIHVDLVCQRMCGKCGREKVTKYVREQVDTLLTVMRNLRVDPLGFVTSDDFSGLQVRIPRPGEEPRDIAHIHPDELALAVRRVAACTIGLTREDLLDATARALGYARAGHRIQTALDSAFDTLTAEGVILMVDGKVHAVEEE